MRFDNGTTRPVAGRHRPLARRRQRAHRERARIPLLIRLHHAKEKHEQHRLYRRRHRHHRRRSVVLRPALDAGFGGDAERDRWPAASGRWRVCSAPNRQRLLARYSRLSDVRTSANRGRRGVVAVPSRAGLRRVPIPCCIDGEIGKQGNRMQNITRKLATLFGILFVAMALGCASTAKQEGTANMSTTRSSPARSRRRS